MMMMTITSLLQSLVVDVVSRPNWKDLGRVLDPKSRNRENLGLDWIEQGLTSHSTHFGSFRGRWGDCGISQDCKDSQSPQCVRCLVCA